MKTSFKIDFFDIVPIKAYLRWVRPSAFLMNNIKMDANFKITSQINKLGYLDF